MMLCFQLVPSPLQGERVGLRGDALATEGGLTQDAARPSA